MVPTESLIPFHKKLRPIFAVDAAKPFCWLIVSFLSMAVIVAADWLYELPTAWLGICLIPIVASYGTRNRMIVIGVAVVATFLLTLHSLRGVEEIASATPVREHWITYLMVWLTSAFCYYLVWKEANAEQRHQENIEDVRSMNERVELSVRGASDALWHWEVQKNTVWYSRRYPEILGYTLDNFPGVSESFYSGLHPDDHDQVWAQINATLEEGAVWHLEYRIKNADGDYIWILSRAEAVRGRDGKVVKIAGSIQDITDRKNAELQAEDYKSFLDNKVKERTQELENLNQELRSEIEKRDRAESRYQDLYHNSPVCYATVNSKTGEIEECNETLARLIGKPRAQLIGSSVYDIYDPGSSSAIRRARDHFKKTGEIRNAELKIGCANGTTLDVVLNASAVRDQEGNIIASRSVWRDISELVQTRRQLEATNFNLDEQVADRTRELEEKNKELKIRNDDLDRFAKAASHDLKGPLQGIDHLVTWIQEDAQDVMPETSRRHLELIQNRTRRLNQLVKGILDFSRATKTNYDQSRVDVFELINEVIELNVPDTFHVKIARTLPTIDTYHAPLLQVFTNLISNAVKHHDKNEGTIEISWQEHAEQYLFTVSNDGPGIPVEYQEKIFDMFSTLKPKDETEGSGIGLALIRRTIESLGGTIKVRSDGDRGVAFEFAWPKLIEDAKSTCQTELLISC